MIAGVELLVEVAELAAIAGTAAIVIVHTRRRHRRLRLRAGARAFDPSSAHAFREDPRDPHVCACGRGSEHDIHHRIGGIG